ncbi:MAG TPA: AAA family ATPase [Trebonia sp.]|nr:AAA family ATPase [Trebonia sp.]
MPDTTFKAGFDQLASGIGQLIRGNGQVVRLALVCLFAEGHLLIEGPPGVAKTSLAKAIAQSVTGAGHKRIQFTPDLLPSDVTGSRVYRQGAEPEFEPGPVFTNILIADEINRASPRTQSALLEVMGERQVTVDGETRAVPAPFLCVATQNPADHRGTFPLPEAQIDRFMMKVTMTTPDRAAEMDVLTGALSRRALPGEIPPGRRLSLGQVQAMISAVRDVRVDDSVKGYLLDIVAATRTGPAGPGSRRGQRQPPEVVTGVSTRATLALALAAQAHAASAGRAYAAPDDVKAVAVPVLAHRLVLSEAAADRGVTAAAVIARLLDRLPVPSPEQAARATWQAGDTPAARVG